MHTLIIAGGIPQPEEKLYPFTQGKPKAMLDICGKPMVQWVLDAVGSANHVEDVILIGLTQASGVTCSRPLTFIPNHGSMIENILAGISQVLQIDPSATQVLLVSSDIPAITPQMVDWEIETCSHLAVDLCYNVITRDVIEARYPGSKRTYTRLRDMEVCGGDMNMLSTRIATMNSETWEKLIAARKNPLKQAAILGFDTLLLALLGIISLDETVRKATARLHMTGKAIICPYAEVGMDVDKPHQLEMLRADLALRK